MVLSAFDCTKMYNCLFVHENPPPAACSPPAARLPPAVRSPPAARRSPPLLSLMALSRHLTSLLL